MKRVHMQMIGRDYPLLLANAHTGIGDGWYFILDSVCALITQNDSETTANQVKEKFGSLRFYMRHGSGEHPNFSSGVVMMAGRLSESICEECGAPGALYGGGWYSARCDRHVTDRQAGSIKHIATDSHVFGLGEGWSRIINIATELFANNTEQNNGPVVVVRASKNAGVLVVTATGGGDRELGAIALINHYGNRIDEHSGEPLL